MTTIRNPVPPAIARMKKERGIYMIVVEAGIEAPLYVDEEGNVWSMSLDSPLRDDGWTSQEIKIVGPLNANSPEV